jgi:mRNA interferase MazF
VRADDIYLARFPFGDVPGMKLRPVLLLTGKVGNVPEVLVAYISSVVPPVLLDTDILIDPNLSEVTPTNLRIISILRLHRIAATYARNVVRYLGRLPSSMSAEVDDQLRTLLSL